MRSLCARAQVPGNSLVRLPGRLASDEIGWGRLAVPEVVDSASLRSPPAHSSPDERIAITSEGGQWHRAEAVIWWLG